MIAGGPWLFESSVQIGPVAPDVATLIRTCNLNYYKPEEQPLEQVTKELPRRI
jgi:hypothetical protein